MKFDICIFYNRSYYTHISHLTFLQILNFSFWTRTRNLCLCYKIKCIVNSSSSPYPLTTIHIYTSSSFSKYIRSTNEMPTSFSCNDNPRDCLKDKKKYFLCCPNFVFNIQNNEIEWLLLGNFSSKFIFKSINNRTRFIH